MSDVMLVGAAVLAATAVLVALFLPARAVAGGIRHQEALVVVRGGYFPDTVVVRAGSPVRVTFRREESSPCSRMVIFAGVGKPVDLPEGEPVAIVLPPREPGTYQFTCGSGRLRGRLVVEAD